MEAADQCPLWVRSGHGAIKLRCPLYPRKQTSQTAVRMSALCHKQTFAGRGAIIDFDQIAARAG